MISLNTNLISQLVASNLKSSSVGLNNAIERMTTGFKLNHAKDNAANFSISTSLSTKLGAYNVAQENAAMGLDMVQTASSSLSLMSNLGSRLHSLAIQANNGTYGGSSLDAIQSEASSIVQELFRIAGTTQYNGMYLFGGGQSSSNIATNAIATLAASTAQVNTQAATNTVGPTVSFGNFIVQVFKRDTSEHIMPSLSEIDSGDMLNDGTYSISTSRELQQLAEMTNNGLVNKNVTFVLANDIDVSDIGGITPIGRDGAHFSGVFDGNGYEITGLNDDLNEGLSGLFGWIDNATITNLGVSGKMTNTTNGGLLCGIAENSTIRNCYSTGIIEGNTESGGLVGVSNCTNIVACYSRATVKGTETIGGLCGLAQNSQITASFTTGDVITETRHSGGLVGVAIDNTEINNCYTKGNVSSNGDINGGLIGMTQNVTIQNCYTTGNIEGKGSAVGGLVGICNNYNNSKTIIKNSYASGSVTGDGDIGGLVGNAENANISNSYATGKVQGNNCVGGLIGNGRNLTISKSYADNNVTNSNIVGGIAGILKNSTLEKTYYTEKTTQSKAIGSFNQNTGDEPLQISQELLNKMIVNGVLPGTVKDSSSISPAPPNNNPDVGKGFNATLQVGIHGTESDKIEVSIDALDLASLENLDLSNGNAIDTINKFLKNINEQQTSLGAVENRLMSTIESIGVNIDNLTSTQSTIRDADIAKESSEYIRNQILQQAAATLLATANQNPSIALQLL